MPQGSSHQEQLRRQLATLPCRPAGSLGVWAPAVWCTMLGWAGWWPRQCCLAASMACQPSCCAGGSLGPPKRAASGNASPALLSAAGCTARCMQMCHLIAGPSMQLAVLRPAETRKGVKGMLQVLACQRSGICAQIQGHSSRSCPWYLGLQERQRFCRAYTRAVFWVALWRRHLPPKDRHALTKAHCSILVFPPLRSHSC